MILLVVLLSSTCTLLPASILPKDWLNAGSLSRDTDGAYLVNDIDYIIDYATDAINGCNPDFEGKLDADLWVL